tara:strand:+ start:255 stop:2489 length:2235 start_codon:yes stop_codon:yes gene_type:complete
MNKNYHIISHDLQMHSALKHIEDYDFHAFDTETTGLNTRKDTVIGMSYSGKVGEAYYIVRKTWCTEKNELIRGVSEDVFVKALEMIAAKDLLMWNASYDCRIVNSNFKIDLKPSLAADVMLMKHLVNEEGFFGLKTVAVEYQHLLNMDMERAANEEALELKENVAKNGGSTTRANYEMYKADLEIMGKYACADADLTFKLGQIFLDKIKEESLDDFFFDDEAMPLYREVTMPMEEKGVQLNIPLIEKTKVEIEAAIKEKHDDIIQELMAIDEVYTWLCLTADSKYPAKKAGNFGQAVVKKFGLDLPISEKTGKYSMGKKLIEALPDSEVKTFLLGEGDLCYEDSRDIQIELWEASNGGFINISSKKQLGEIVFDNMGHKPLSKTLLGSPQFNDTLVQHLSEKGFEWATKLGDYNKLVKQKGAYIDRFLDNHEDGFYYFYYKQHGTLSGRFSSDAQQLPRPKEEGELSPTVLYFNNLIRSFFIAGEGRIFVDADYESLEPHVFAHVSGDEGLRNIFRKGHDFYSTIAIATEKLEGVSADKKADNYLGKVNKPLRQKAKAYSLGIPYGLTPYALSKTLEVSQEEAQELYDGYLDGFPELKLWMQSSRLQAKSLGYVSTQTGRVRHLPRVKELYKKHGDKLLDFKYRKKLEKKHGKDSVLSAYRDYKNGLNNSLNFQIQGLSASIVNRAMIGIMREFKRLNIDAWVCGTIHDQIIVNAPIAEAERCSKIVGNYVYNCGIKCYTKSTC